MKKIKLHWWIIIGMVVGALLGTLVNSAYDGEAAVRASAIYQAFDGLAGIFMKLLKMVVIPLVFFSLISGMLGMGNLASLGRTGVRTFVFYIFTSFLAIITGLLLVNIIRPGVGTGLNIPTAEIKDKAPESFWEVITNMVPENIVSAAANFDLLGVIIFAIFFGACLLVLKDERRRTLETFVEAVSEIMMKMTEVVISLAPVGIAALIARMVAVTGLDVFASLWPYALTVLAALGIHLLVTLPLLIRFTTGLQPYRYLRAMSPAFLTGFSTASSSGTLAVTMNEAENAGVSNKTASFVLPLGATINMDGTALYEIVTVLFIAQVHAGIDPNFTLTFADQLLIVFLGLTVSIGAAGIPHAGLVMMVIILNAVGLPIEYTALIWAIDRPLDMCRTMTNIASDSSITLIMAHKDNELDKTVLWGEQAT